MPFHKLTQWLTYSLMDPMTKLLSVQFVGTDLLTGLPEYRNGGLLVDTGLLTLRGEPARRGLATFQENALIDGQPSVEVVPLFRPDDDVIVEWRAVTVGILDELLVEVNKLLGLQGPRKLSMAQMLEAGSWKVRSNVCGQVDSTVMRSNFAIRPGEKLRQFRDPTRKGRLLESFQACCSYP